MKRKIITFLIALGIAGVLTGCGEDKKSVLAQAMSAVEKGDYDTANALFERSLVANENKKLVYRGQGINYLAQGDYDNAEAFLEKALGESNGIIEDVDIDISYYLAVAFSRNGKNEEALNTLNAVIGLKPDLDVAYYLRGKLYLANGNKESAIADYDRAVELRPSNYDNYIRICEDLRDLGYKEESDIYIQRAMNQNTKLSNYSKGVFEYYLGSYTEARNDLENANKNEKNENLYLYLGKTYEALGDTGYAMELYQKALSDYPVSGKIYNQLAMCRLAQRDYQGALETIELGLNSGDGEALSGLMFNRVVAYEYLYDFENAKKSMDEYLKKYPEDEKALRENTFLSSR